MSGIATLLRRNDCRCRRSPGWRATLSVLIGALTLLAPPAASADPVTYEYNMTVTGVSTGDSFGQDTNYGFNATGNYSSSWTENFPVKFTVDPQAQTVNIESVYPPNNNVPVPGWIPNANKGTQPAEMGTVSASLTISSPSYTESCTVPSGAYTFNVYLVPGWGSGPDHASFLAGKTHLLLDADPPSLSTVTCNDGTTTPDSLYVGPEMAPGIDDQSCSGSAFDVPVASLGPQHIDLSANPGTLSCLERGPNNRYHIPFSGHVSYTITLDKLPGLVVNTTDDTNDNNAGDGACMDSNGNCSVRAAIEEANAQVAAHPSATPKIAFNIPGADVQTVTLASALPTVADGVTIDATTQPGYAGTPLVALVGMHSTDGLILGSHDSVAGLQVSGFSSGVRVLGSNTVLREDSLGPDSTSSGAPGNIDGALISGSHDTIGPGNVVSGNSNAGVMLAGSALDDTVNGDLIGTDQRGQHALGNQTGVVINGTSGNTIGGTRAEDGNTISGNTKNGVFILGTAAEGNSVLGNLIGTDSSGESALPNGTGGKGSGVLISSGAYGNAVGRGRPASVTGCSDGCNVISGNQTAGVGLSGAGSSNTIEGNLIGTSRDGNAGIANGEGVLLDATSGTLIGGSGTGEGNLISGNFLAGVQITAGSSGNFLEGNTIGPELGGTEELHLSNSTGVVIDGGASANTIGGDGAADHNQISANRGDGIDVNDGTTTDNKILGNGIGTYLGNGGPLPNHGNGITIDGAPQTVIGGTDTASRNYISGNDGAGVSVKDGAWLTNVTGNYIGIYTEAAKAAYDGNRSAGVQLQSDERTTIGGEVSRAGNVISGNGGFGVESQSSRSALIAANKIGTDAAGSTAVGNHDGGISIAKSVAGWIGSVKPGAGNVISGNGGGTYSSVGLSLLNDAGLSVVGNRIGTTADGLSALPNSRDGIDILGSNMTIGGPNQSSSCSGACNLVSANGHAGIQIEYRGADDAGVAVISSSHDVVLGNFVGTDVAGRPTLGNHAGGIIVHGHDNVIGGADTGAGNRIAANNEGIVLANDAWPGEPEPQNITILGNSIFKDQGLGIDLGGTHKLLPDHPGGDVAGPNNDQNFPVLTSLTAGRGRTARLTGTLDSDRSTEFRIQVFENEQCDPSGFGEGEQLREVATVKTDAAGHASFDLQVAHWTKAFATATATNLTTGNTSEFSRCVELGTGSAEVSPSTTKPGGSVVLQENGLKPGSTATATLRSRPVLLGRLHVGARGSLDARLRLPLRLARGHHTITIVGKLHNGRTSTHIVDLFVE